MRDPPVLGYVEMYRNDAEGRVSDAHVPLSSDTIGFGITSSAVLQHALARYFDVRPIAGREPMQRRCRPADKLRWIYEQYARVVSAAEGVDALFVFHVANTFASELRRALLDLGCDVPLVGYTHGSHWDASDTFRTERYPGMEITDLGNLLALDRVFVVSEYMRDVVVENVTRLNRDVGDDLRERLLVAPLPIDHAGIRAAGSVPPRRQAEQERCVLVFNHSFTTAKQPELLAQLLPDLLKEFADLECHFTRAVSTDGVGRELRRLAAHQPNRVVLHEDLPIASYFALLGHADLQVSCASHESFGVATVEAMYAGCCCVVPRTGTLPSLMAATPEVLYDGTSAGLRRTLQHFLRDPDARAATATRQQRTAGTFTGDAAAAIIARAIEAIRTGSSGTA